MRAPAFWSDPKPGALAHLLSPLGSLYGAVTLHRMEGKSGTVAPIPVVCVGNLTAGGAGKTPVALALHHLLLAAGRKPGFLSRGYGGQLTGPLLVDPATHSAAQVGDEPLLLAAQGPTAIAKRRPDGVTSLVRAGVDTIIMDDGFQNPSISKTASLVVIDPGHSIGNGLCVPAGPLRAPAARQLRHADAIIIAGAGDLDPPTLRLVERSGRPVFRVQIGVDPHTRALTGRKVLAFAGIGRPEKLFETLRAASADLVATHAFADHHLYTESELGRLIRDASVSGAVLATTEKDAVRLRTTPWGLEALKTLHIVRIDAVFTQPTKVSRFLMERMEAAGGEAAAPNGRT
ncbi:MAG: tetraacyldisaccharide 4'-kinase [Pseudomonadota bacterium]